MVRLRVLLCIQNCTPRGLIVYECLQAISLRSFNNSTEKGNLKQHVAHFVETCNNAGTDGDLLTKQFVHSLRGNAFDWYTDLEPKSIDNWEQWKGSS